MSQTLADSGSSGSSAGKVAVLFAGLGSLATTAIGCCLLLRQGVPVELSARLREAVPGGGSLPRTLADAAPMFDWVPPGDLVFGGWDIKFENAHEMAAALEVIPADLRKPIAPEMKKVRPMPAVFFPEQAADLWNSNVKRAEGKKELAEAVAADIHAFKEEHGCRRAVVLWTGSRETPPAAGPSHASAAAFRTALRSGEAAISASQIYAAAAFQTGSPFVAAGASRTVSFPAFAELAALAATPFAGENLAVPDFQSVPADAAIPLPAAQNPLLRLRTPSGGGFEAEYVESADFPSGPRPRRESRAAAPSLLEVALWLDLANRRGMAGPQQWLNVYFSRPSAPLEPGRDFAAFQTQVRQFARGGPAA